MTDMGTVLSFTADSTAESKELKNETGTANAVTHYNFKENISVTIKAKSDATLPKCGDWFATKGVNGAEINAIVDSSKLTYQNEDYAAIDIAATAYEEITGAA